MEGRRSKPHEHTMTPDEMRALVHRHIEEGFMAINRALMKPSRIKLAGDPE